MIRFKVKSDSVAMKVAQNDPVSFSVENAVIIGTPADAPLTFVVENGTQVALSSVGGIVIPEGEVLRVVRGDELLWEKPTTPYKKELAYIESNKTQWIDTGITSPLIAEAKIQGTESRSGTSIVISMGTGSAAGDWFGFTTVWTLGSSAAFDNAYDEIITATCHFTGSALTVTVGDITKTRDGTTSGTLRIGSPVSNYPSSCRIYALKIYDAGDKVVRDFIPVLDWYNKPCMYDKVSGELFYNKGTGDFLYA